MLEYDLKIHSTFSGNKNIRALKSCASRHTYLKLTQRIVTASISLDPIGGAGATLSFVLFSDKFSVLHHFANTKLIRFILAACASYFQC